MPTQSVDRPIPRSRRDPCPRIRRDTPDGPRLERGDERLLDDLLREVEVPKDTDQGRDGPPLLLAEQAVDDLVRSRVSRAQLTAQLALAAAAAADGAMSPKSTMGRTSMEPCRAPGIIAA